MIGSAGWLSWAPEVESYHSEKSFSDQNPVDGDRRAVRRSRIPWSAPRDYCGRYFFGN